MTIILEDFSVFSPHNAHIVPRHVIALQLNSTFINLFVSNQWLKFNFMVVLKAYKRCIKKTPFDLLYICQSYTYSSLL